MSRRRILVTGGAGYVGSALVPRLLSLGHYVTVLDLMIYGEAVIDKHPNLRMVKGDIRDIGMLCEVIPGHDSIIHLACISNDPSFELDPQLGKEINLDAFRPFVTLAKASDVQKFIYASSSSVYGVSDEPVVHEGIPLAPITDYSKFKAECEIILSEFTSSTFSTTILRPATVCGYARRQRLDVVVNIFANYAYNTGTISVLGGSQVRPNIHIQDMVDAYITVLHADSERVNGSIYNVGCENHTVLQLAEIVKAQIGSDVQIHATQSSDPRSYRISSDLISRELGFAPSRSIAQAVTDLKYAFASGWLPNSFEDDRYFNIRMMKAFKDGETS